MSVEHYTIDEHDIPPGVTVYFVKDSSGRIVRDGLHIDDAEAIAERMNEEANRETEDLDDDE